MAKNQLDSRKSYKLMRWADSHREEFRGHTYKEIVTMATAAMGYTVTTANIIGVVTALDIDTAVLKPKKADGGDLFVNTLADRLAKLEEECVSLTKRLAEYELLVERLAARVLGRTN